ncbi:unnamed protein product [Diabrotica balteata]|uniref:TIL domain-containing protein n=1 Tax=Diabrotica balteata TaxID=107213 RepID=A0A9N9XJQ0_DIABA|nr:unnamed protein product [Diabrotica balteata]
MEKVLFVLIALLCQNSFGQLCDRCGPNQVYGCRPCCPEATCDNPKPPPCTRICPLICFQECLCKEGYVRNTINGQCCPPGEIWNDCASCDPEATCQNRIPEAPGICPAVCQQRCECDSKNGLIRDQISGQCVPIEKCPGCLPGEIWNECASCNPDPTCQNSTVQIQKYVQIYVTHDASAMLKLDL